MSLKSTREFILRERVGSLKDKVWVLNVNKDRLGYFKGNFLKNGNTIRLYDLEENSLLTAHEKTISMRSTYTFYRGGEQDHDKMIGKIKRKIKSVKPSYWYEDLEENKVFTMNGNFLTLKYKIFKLGEEIADVHKKFYKSSFKDSYSVKIADDVSDDDVILILGMVIILHYEKEENS